MLASHASSTSEALLTQLARDSEASVAATALQSLNQSNPAAAVAMADPLLQHADPGVRYQMVRALAQVPEPRSVVLLAGALADHGVAARTLARETLVAWAVEPPLAEAVREQTRRVLSGDQWRALEQASLIVGEVDDEFAADLLIELLSFDRPEVRLAAADGLRELAVPETLPAILAQTELLTRQMEGEAVDGPTRDRQAMDREVVQLVMAMGEMRHAPADALLRRYIPKGSPYPAGARAAAIWALGRIHEEDPDASLTSSLRDRLADGSIVDPESLTVRRFAATALGRMKVEDALPTLRSILDRVDYPSVIREACRWAIEQITGEDVPPLERGVVKPGTWFLEPTD